MSKVPFDEALLKLGETDPTFNTEIRRRIAPVKERFFEAPHRESSDQSKDGLHATPPYLSDPELRKIAIDLAEFALQRGIDINLACESNGSTFLHGCVLLRDTTVAAEVVVWLLAHGADPNRQRDDGQTPLSLALGMGRNELAELMRA